MAETLRRSDRFIASKRIAFAAVISLGLHLVLILLFILNRSDFMGGKTRGSVDGEGQHFNVSMISIPTDSRQLGSKLINGIPNLA
jgi:hypothetical protein